MGNAEYSEQLKKMMELVVNGASEEVIRERGKEMKIRLSMDWIEIGKILSVLDGIINAYAPDSNWPMGIWVPPPQPQQQPQQPGIIIRGGGVLPGQGNIIIQGQQSSLPIQSHIASNDRILELARRMTHDGTVDCDKIIRQVKAEGDPRDERILKISVGNILNRNKWIRLTTGLYKPPEQIINKEEVKTTTES